MPCTTPPWSWPATISGLMTVPKSLTQEYLTTSTMPVSGSTSTSAIWQPLGKVEALGPSLTWATSSDCGASAGGLGPLCSFFARSMIEIARSVPTMVKRPCSNAMSDGAASSTCAASSLPLSMIFAAASTIAVPVCMIDFEPPEPPPWRAGRCRLAAARFFQTECRGVRSRPARTAWHGPCRNRAFRSSASPCRRR